MLALAINDAGLPDSTVQPVRVHVLSKAAKVAAALALPAAANVAGALLQLFALAFIPAAVLAGLRGAFILFTALLSYRLGLKDAPKSQREWLWIWVSAGGALLVGAASALQAGVPGYTAWAGAEGATGSDDSIAGGSVGTMLIGIALCVGGYAAASAQVAIEQRFLDSFAFSRWQVLGGEGLWGAVTVVAALGAIQGVADADPGALPPPGSAAAGVLDVPSRTACCLAHSPTLIALSLAYAAASLTFNALLLRLTSVGANFRVFVFTARGLLTWVVETAVFYGLAAGSSAAAAAQYGTPLSAFSGLEAAGFALLIYGGYARVRMQLAAGKG
jgi:hypothetical protein